MPKSISLTAIALVVATCMVVLVGLLFDATSSFLSLSGLIIVVGGCVANAFLSYPREEVFKAFYTIRHLLKRPQFSRESLQDDIMQLIRWSYIVHARDFLGLEKESTNDIHDPLIRYGMDLVVTGYSPEKIREMLHTVAEAEFERRSVPVTVLRNMAATAPTFGMVGTLIGMVILLRNVGADISNIGSGLAVAMLATLYGILVARLICLPAADKLLQKEEFERFRSYMLTEGLVMLSQKEKPFYIQDRLNSYLEPAKQFDLDDYEQMASHRRFAMAA